MLRTLILYWLMMLLSYTSFARYEYLLHKPYAERHKVLDSVFYYNYALRDNPKAFLNAINTLAKEAKDEEDIELECEATLLNIAYNGAINYNENADVETIAKQLIARASKYDLIQIEVRARQFLGRYYMEKKGKYLEAIDQFLSSYYLMQQLTVEDFPTKKEHLYHVAHAYYNFGDFANAQKYMMEADKTDVPNGESMLLNKNKVSTYINLQNTLGLIYRNDGRYDSALYYFNKVHKLATSLNDSVWMGIITGNIGITYYLQKQYDIAIPMLKEDIRLSLKSGETDNGVNSLIKLTDIYLQRKDWTTVKTLMDSTRRMVNYTHEPQQHMQHLSYIMAQYYNATGNPALAYRYMDSARIAKDVMDMRKNTKALAIQEQKLQLQQYRAELQKADDEKRLQLLKRNALLVIIILASSLIIVFINGQKRVYRQKTQLAETEKLHAQQELENAAKQLADFTRSIHEKNELIEKISADIEQYQNQTASTVLVPNTEVLSQLQNSILLTEDQWEQFKFNFDKVHIGYLNRLKDKLPDLTPAETRFMVLAKLKLSNKEMAGMLGVSMQGVRNYKYRLRKKLNLPEDGDIDSLVDII